MRRGRAPRAPVAICSASPAITSTCPGKAAAISAKAGRQAGGRPAAPRADLDRGSMRKIACLACDPPGQVEIEKKMLTQGMTRRQPVPGDDLAQRRQVVVWRQSAALRMSMTAE